jgi:hypothetical protein
MTTSAPDFDHIARLVIQRVVAEMPHYATNGLNDDIVEHLRQVWNARCAIAATEGRARADAEQKLLVACEFAFAFIDSVDWTDRTSETRAENVKEVLQRAITAAEGE